MTDILFLFFLANDSDVLSHGIGGIGLLKCEHGVACGHMHKSFPPFFSSVLLYTLLPCRVMYVAPLSFYR